MNNSLVFHKYIIQFHLKLYLSPLFWVCLAPTQQMKISADHSWKPRWILNIKKWVKRIKRTPLGKFAWNNKLSDFELARSCINLDNLRVHIIRCISSILICIEKPINHIRWCGISTFTLADVDADVLNLQIWRFSLNFQTYIFSNLFELLITQRRGFRGGGRGRDRRLKK